MALINNNADEIFTLQSLHNQGIGSGGGGGGDIGNFISVGRDANSFPGFYSIAMGENTIAAGEGAIAVGDECKSLNYYGGLVNGYNNIDVFSGGSKLSGSTILGMNNINFTGNYSPSLINGKDNLLCPYNVDSITLGTNLFIGYWDNSSKILYADKDRTEIVEFTVPASGVFIVDYGSDVVDGRERAFPKVYYSLDGSSYNQIWYSNYSTLISGYDNKVTGLYTYSSNALIGNTNTIKRSGNSAGSSVGSEMFYVFGQNNMIDHKTSSNDNTGYGIFAFGQGNQLFRMAGFLLGRENKVGGGNKQGQVHILGDYNRIYDTTPHGETKALFVIGTGNHSSGADGYRINNYLYNAFTFGTSNMHGDGIDQYIYGTANKFAIGKDIQKIVKVDDQYYRVNYSYNENTGEWSETQTALSYFYNSSLYFYNNKFYCALSDNSGLDLDHPIPEYKFGNPNKQTNQAFIIGRENYNYGNSNSFIVGTSNQVYIDRSVAIGDSNFIGGGTSASGDYVLGHSNSVFGQYNTTIGKQLVNEGKYNNVSGAYNSTGGEDSSNAITPNIIKQIHTGATSLGSGNLCQLTGQLYTSENYDSLPGIGKELRLDSAYNGLIQNPSNNDLYKAAYGFIDDKAYFIYNANTQRFELCFNPDYVDLQETGTYATTIHGICNGAFKGTANTIEGLNNYINHYKTVGCHLEGSSIVLSDNVYRFAAHAEGYNTYIGASYAHAEGYMTRASGEASHAGGNNTIAQGANQTAIGKFNIADTNNAYAFIIGNGAAEATRANALTVDWSGNLTIAGNLSMPNLTIINRGDLTNKAYVDDYITDAYDDTETYDIGDYCIYNNTLYRCIVAIAVAESFTSAHWVATTIAEELQTKQNSSDNNLNTTNKTIVGAINELESKLWVDFDNTLTAGATTITVSDVAITATSAIDVYTNVWGVEPTNMVLANGSVTLTFEAQASDVNVKVRVS